MFCPFRFGLTVFVFLTSQDLATFMRFSWTFYTVADVQSFCFFLAV